jgi:hypothetical protein
MEPLVTCFKNVHSPLYDRRLAIFILKKYSHGRRSFSESARFTKIKSEHRERHHEPEAKTFKAFQTNKKTEETSESSESPRWSGTTSESPRFGSSYEFTA